MFAQYVSFGEPSSQGVERIFWFMSAQNEYRKEGKNIK